MLEIIEAKRDGFALSEADINRLVQGYVNGEVPDYQMSAFLMSVYINGLNFDETIALTKSIIKSGKILDLSSIPFTKADKHSTGGIGDKTTFIVVPVLTCCGLIVPKMSGRGLGFTGGTLDKLESIPGYNTRLNTSEIVSQLKSIGAVMAGQTSELVPADKKIYALRDVTATVESIPLIAASVMSKKIACSSDVIVLDVKYGKGAFVKDYERAKLLSQTMMAIGKGMGRKVGIVISEMSQPLGYAVGNALEVAEAVNTLKGDSPEDLLKLSIELSASVLYKAGQASNLDEGREKAKKVIQSGEALAKFKEIITAQNGDVDAIDDLSLLPQAALKIDVISRKSGFVSDIDGSHIGRAASHIGAGRQKVDDVIDHSVGVVVKKKIGDYVEIGEPVATLHMNNAGQFDSASSLILESYELAQNPPEKNDIIREIILN